MLERNIQKSANEIGKENAQTCEFAKNYIQSKNWNEYIHDLEKRSRFLKKSIAVSEDVKKNHPKEVDNFNSEIFPEIEDIKKLILKLTQVNNSLANSLIKELELLRGQLKDLIITEEDRNRYGMDREVDSSKNSEPELEEIEVVEEHFSEEKINEFIKDIQEQANWYRKNYLGEVLVDMKNKYLLEKDPRLKELLGDEFERIKEQIVIEIDKYEASVPLIEDFGISTALAELHETRNEINSLDKDSVEKSDETRAA